MFAESSLSAYVVTTSESLIDVLLETQCLLGSKKPCMPPSKVKARKGTKVAIEAEMYLSEIRIGTRHGRH